MTFVYNYNLVLILKKKYFLTIILCIACIISLVRNKIINNNDCRNMMVLLNIYTAKGTTVGSCSGRMTRQFAGACT